MEQITLDDQLSTNGLPYLIRIDRLQVLVVALEEVAEDEEMAMRFDLDNWIGQPWVRPELGSAGFRDPNRATECILFEEFQNACGTAACAIGLAGLIPVFQEQGFCCERRKDADKIWPAYQPSGSGDFHKLTNWTAVEEFFGLTPWEANWLFARSSYALGTPPGPLDVAARINQLIEKALA